MFAQCPGNINLSFTSTPTTSTCEANGSIEIFPIGGVPFTDPNGAIIYSNAIIAGPVLYSSQSATVFNALLPGTYTIEVADACGTTVTNSVTVSGNYSIPDLNFTVTDAACVNQPLGEISIQAFSGLPPYSYRLIDLNVMPPDTVGIQTDSIFSNLLAGDYQIQVFDQCNNFQTRNVVVGETSYGTLSPIITPVSYNCDSILLLIRLIGIDNGLPPFNWEIIAAPADPSYIGTTGQLNSNGSRDTLFYTNFNNIFVIEVTDACGTTATWQTSPPGKLGASGVGLYDCDLGNGLSMGAFNVINSCLPDSITHELIAGPVTRPPQDSGIFWNLPAGTYIHQVTDCCGNTASIEKEVKDPEWTTYMLMRDDKSCIDSTTYLRFSVSNNDGPLITRPYYSVLYDAPPGVTVPDTIFNAWPENSTIQNATLGNYCWFTEDACGRRDSACFLADEPFLFDLDFQLDLNCITDNSLIINYTSTSDDIEFQFDTILGYNPGAFNYTTNTTFNNLTEGTYVLTAINDSRGCILQSDTIVIPPYIQPYLESAWGVECENGDGLITTIAGGGQPPYTYEIFNGPVTRPLQSSPVFTGLISGTYDIRVFDDCTNSFITSVSIEPFNPVIKGYAGPYCPENNFLIYVDSVAGADYQWSGPNGFSSTNSQVSFNNVSTLEAGIYSVFIDLIGCDTQTLTLLVEIDDCFDCNTVQANGGDICSIIGNDLAHPLGSLDCDGGGISNIIECITGNDPTSVVDDIVCTVDECMEANLGNLDICAILGNDPAVSLATLDCDGGGIDNLSECNAGNNPIDASDDCNYALTTANFDLCATILADNSHPLSMVDCDGGGVNNLTECQSGEDPSNPSDDCITAINEGLLICALFVENGILNPNHPMASLDCDGGGIDNFTECSNHSDPADAEDDCTTLLDTGTDICSFLSINPNHPLSTIDCDGDGVNNTTECSESSNPSDPCDYLDDSISLPVTSDQSDCPVECPDLSPVITVVPGNIQGIASVSIAVEIFELNTLDTDGSSIIVRIPSDPRLTFAWDPMLTSVAFTTVDNSIWTYLGNTGVVHQFQYNNLLTGGNVVAFGLEAIYDPQNTDGQTTITSTIIPFNGGECNILNNTDAERLVYFE